MGAIPHDHISLWIATAPGPYFGALQRDVDVDVAVLGGGIVGLTTAMLLSRAGKTVAVVESDRIVQGVTGYTTAKVTSGHNLIYARMIDTFGEEAARIYGESNQAALERIAQFVADDGIDCDWQRTPHYCYAEARADLNAVEDEVVAAQSLGLPVDFTSEVGLPYPVAGAIRFDNQAQFHPRRYLLALAERLTGNGGFIFEETRVLDVEEGNPCRVVTDNGVVRACDVVVATHFPILDRGLFFARVFPRREYAISVRADASTDPGGMYISSGEPTRSVRTAPAPGGLRLIIGGEHHRPGEEQHTDERYRRLEEFAHARFGLATIEYRWSTQDNDSIDGVPFIGRLRASSDHLYVATGFGGWGMTNGTLAGMIISDLILELPNPWAALYDPRRLTFQASASTRLTKLIQEGTNAARHFIGDRLTVGVPSLVEIAPGAGAIVDAGGEKLAVYRDEQGAVHALSAVCTHMHCLVGWNTAEKSWDCPCHGSRFSSTGQVIHGPAVEDLRSKEVADGEPENAAASPR